MLSQLYARWKADLIRTERIILKELGFALYQLTEHPHRCVVAECSVGLALALITRASLVQCSYILYYARALGCSSAVAQLAWSLLNDSLRLTLCVRFHAESIACAAIYLAARSLAVPLPREVPWYEIFNTRREDMLAIAEEILGLYERPRTTWLRSLRAGARPGEEDDEGEPSASHASAGSLPLDHVAVPDDRLPAPPSSG